jgi:glycosyltransferase involved in cell wall biosynthesis
MTKTISVIIPVYNGEKYIGACLDSVLHQTLKPYEVIVVDDGSTDRTYHILKRYGARIRLMRIEHSGGCSEPRNIGLDAARGDYIAFIDADDTWAAAKLQRQMETVERFPGVRFFCTDFFTRHPAGYMIRQFDRSRFPQEIGRRLITFDSPFDAFPLLIERNFVGCPSTVILERSLIKETGGFDPRFNSAEDLDYWIRCSLHSPCFILRLPLVYKRTHQDNMTRHQDLVLATHRGILKRMVSIHGDQLRKRGLAGALRRARASLNLSLAHSLKQDRLRDKAKLYLESVTLDPLSVPRDFLKQLRKRS